jgi:hypothetical protein
MVRKISKIYVHHSALPMEKEVDEIRKLHIRRGFKDIGYHFVINKEGKIQKGRSIEEEGAHVKSDNKESIGICVCGNLEEVKPTTLQIKALEELILELCQKWGKLKILGHRDYLYSNTLCPGKYLYELLPKIRKKIEVSLRDV